MRRIAGFSNGSRILAVTHVSIIRALMIYHNGMHLDDYRKIDIPNGACYFIYNKKSGTEIRRVL